MLFVITAVDKPDSLALRLAVREAHFAFVRENAGVKLGGPFLNDDGEMAGSMIVVEAADRAAAEAWHASDPYVKAGLFVHSEVRPWKPTYNPIEATL
jgi:uncharacterized protein YciI